MISRSSPGVIRRVSHEPIQAAGAIETAMPYLDRMLDFVANLSARVTISAEGKTRTVHVTQTDSAGKKITGTAVYDKQ
jgi:hypothetical protein